VEQVIAEYKPGALAFGLSMRKCSESQHYRDDLMARSWKIPLICKIDEPQLSLEEALQRKETEWEMWEEIEPDDGQASTEAAVALNGWLWQHCGGWRNTFG
jgi:hypothetical protein